MSMLSCVDSNSDEDLQFWIIGQSLSSEDGSLLRSLVQSPKVVVNVLDTPDLEALADTHLHIKDFSLSTYTRLWLSEILPIDGRLIYLDADTQVTGSLSPIWKKELAEGSILAGVLDAASAKSHRAVGQRPDSPYVNAGVLVIDLDRWREREMTQRCTTYLFEHEGHVPQNDQGVINACLDGSIEPLEMRYDVMTYALAFSYDEIIRYKRPSNWYSEAEYLDSRRNPVVLHATGSFLYSRPWLAGSSHPMASRFQSYQPLIPWQMPTSNQRNEMHLKILRKACEGPLRSPTISSLGVLQAYFRSLFPNY